MPGASLLVLLGALGAGLGSEAQLPAQQEANVACEDPSACAGKSGNRQGVLLVQVRRDHVAKSATGVTGNSTGTVSLSEEVDWPKDYGKKDDGKEGDGKEGDGKEGDGKKDDGKKDDGKKDGKSDESKGSASEKSWKGKGETGGKGEKGTKGGVDEKAVKGKEEPGKDGVKGKGEPGKDGRYTTSSPSETPGKDGMKGKGEPGKHGKYTTSSPSEMPAKGAGKEEKGAKHSPSGKSWKEEKGYAGGAEESEIKALLGTKMWKMYQDLANRTAKTQIMLAKLLGEVQQLSSCCDSSTDKNGKAYVVPTTTRLNGPVSAGGAPTTTTTTLSGEDRSGEPGLCAVFGDPHFITFDGGHTVLVGERVIWLVKTESVWIQGVSLGAEGKFAGFAVGGAFMKGHTVLLFNNSDAGKIHTVFDGECVLNNTVDEYHVEGVLDAYREDEWDAQIFNDRILSMRTEAKFESGAWHERFLGKPRGGLYVLKLPGGVELTVTGVDFLSAVITMPRPSDSEDYEQGGYCGNFNGDPEDDADPVVPSWNTPLGKDLDPVDPALNLFLSKRVPALFQLKGDPATAAKAEARQAGGNLLPLLDAVAACPKELRKQADAACANLEDARLQRDCIFDVCLTRNAEVADEMLAADILEEEVNAHGIPVFMGHGRCADTAGRPFDALTTTLRTEKECQELLRTLALSEGVLGAQLRRTSTCEVLVSAGADPTSVMIPGGWGEKRGAGSAGHGLIRGIVQEGVKDDTASWSCWKLV